MLTGIAACKLTGMPKSHADAFQLVANETKCVISSRDVGIYATGLLLESYATKGFHNKAKSCNWGPMAGFVLADPQFTKRGIDIEALGAQAFDLSKAFHSGAGTIPIFISERRRMEVQGLCALGSPQAGSTDSEKIYIAKGKRFVLKRTMNAPGGNGKMFWMVCYATGETKFDSSLRTTKSAGVTPVLAMVDPACPGSVRDTYRGATTGDYDLFAVFPPNEGAQGFSKARDARVVPGSDRFKVPMKTFAAAEDPHMGNMTHRLKTIRMLLNQAVKNTGYSGGDVVHHSDEAGRPMVSDISFPFIAFIPGKTEAYAVKNVDELKEFIKLLGFKYYVTFNPGWHQQLGIEVSPGGSYEGVGAVKPSALKPPRSKEWP